MKIKLLIIFSTVLSCWSFGQNRGVPIATYFKDYSAFSDSSFAPVFPISNNEVGVFPMLQDTQKRYTTFGHFLFQRELIEVHKPEGDLWITPILDIQGGIERGDTNLRQFYNTRGARIEACIGKKVFVSTSVYENQAFLPYYVRNYVSQRGEYFPNSADSSYSQVNAMIPNAARTKPFKSGGYDYAYATGYVKWDVTKWLAVSGGNQPLFVGSGYRSLLFSDNTAPSMFGRIQVRIGKLLDYQIVRGQGMNLLRLPYAENGEALYERKAFAITSLYFKPTKNLRLGLVETSVWSRGDSIQKKPVSGCFYIPLPGGALLQEAIESTSYSLLALDMNYRAAKWLSIYGQFGTHRFQANSELVQLGLHLWPLNKPEYSLQIEYNHTGKQAYQSANPRLNFSSFNLPLGHIMGYGVDELVIRIQAEYRKIFLNLFTNVYFNQNAERTFLLPVYNGNPYTAQRVFNQRIELGYRFNRSYGFEVFGSFQIRKASGENYSLGYWANLGIRMQLNNHYFDF